MHRNRLRSRLPTFVALCVSAVLCQGSTCDGGGGGGGGSSGPNCGPGTHVENGACVIDDPSGTTQANLGPGSNDINFVTGAVGPQMVGRHLTFFGNNVSFSTTGAQSFGVRDMGAVGGLANVTDAPTTGYVASVSVVEGHGYVVKLSTNKYVRVFVRNYLLDVNTGGIVGVTIKYTYQADGSTHFTP